MALTRAADASLLALRGTYARLFSTQAHNYQPVEAAAL
ncbi:hypothetical protein JOD67_006668 [Tenggerimyces flavus]|nr:hypothetical protein [Tenggerimyces flavus]